MQPSIFTGIDNLSSLKAYLVNDLDDAFNENPLLDGGAYCQELINETLCELPTSTLTVIMQEPEVRYIWGMPPANPYMSLERNCIERLRVDLTCMLVTVYGTMMDTYASSVQVPEDEQYKLDEWQEFDEYRDEEAVIYGWEEAIG